MIKISLGIISTLGLLGFTALCVLLALYLGKKIFKITLLDRLIKALSPHAYHLAFFLSFIATMASLFLSEVLLFQPCILCWYQRIAMYPQVVLLYIALVRRERVLTPYLIVANIMGAVISLYHYSLHVLPRTLVPLLPCTKAVGGVPCDKGYDFYFGFMTFPLMAWVVFMLIAFLLIISGRKTGKGKIK